MLETDDAQLELLSDCAAHGPVLDLLPHGCAFGDNAAECSFELNEMVGDYEGEALFCVLRKDGEDDPWAPLSSAEGLSLSAVGLATITLQSLSRLILVWVRGLGQAPGFVQMLAQSLLTSMERRGEEPDAAFRASFRLGCVAAVQIRQEWSAGGNL